MTMPACKARIWIAVIGVAAGIAVATLWQFRKDLQAARNRIAAGGIVMQTPCGAIEYAHTGTGMPLLAVHGGGCGYDQGMAFAAPLTARGIRVIAVLRFGYLRSPMPGDGSAEAQADAFVCLLDRLGTHVLNLLHRLVDGKTIGGPDIH